MHLDLRSREPRKNAITKKYRGPAQFIVQFSWHYCIQMILVNAGRELEEASKIVSISSVQWKPVCTECYNTFRQRCINKLTRSHEIVGVTILLRYMA